MTEAILLTGKRGEGKSLSAVKMIARYMARGRIVATNLNLNVDKLCPPWSKSIAYRLPDIPAPADFEMLPLGNPNPVNEKMNGLLVLDECASFLNSRDWQGKDRLNLISWLSQSRKCGWDLLLIAQDKKMLDVQIRDALCDLHGICKRTDKIGIPFVTWFMRHFFDVDVKMPKLHVATFYYGFNNSAPTSFTDIFGGSDYYDGYDTIQKINGISGNQHLFTYLSAWQLKGRYMTRFQMYGRIAALMLVFGLVIGSGVGFLTGYLKKSHSDNLQSSSTAIVFDDSVSVIGSMADGDKTTIILSDGRIERITDSVFDASGARYKVGGKWVRAQK